MFVNKKPIGHILIMVLIIVFVISLFTHTMMQATILEYQRIHNQLLVQQVWQQMETRVYKILDSLMSEQESTINNSKNLGFIADTLELNCNSGLMLYNFEVKSAEQSVQLAVTYSVRI